MFIYKTITSPSFPVDTNNIVTPKRSDSLSLNTHIKNTNSQYFFWISLCGSLFINGWQSKKLKDQQEHGGFREQRGRGNGTKERSMDRWGRFQAHQLHCYSWRRSMELSSSLRWYDTHIHTNICSLILKEVKKQAKLYTSCISLLNLL